MAFLSLLDPQPDAQNRMSKLLYQRRKSMRW